VTVDVLVVGGGPVGLAAAIEARLAGLSATVIERRAGVIDKACGEGLMPGALAAVHRLGVDPPGRPLRGIRYLDGERMLEHRFSGVEGRGVRRLALHSALASRARSLGVAFVEGRVDDVALGAETVAAGGVTARHLLACDGLHSTLRRRLGLESSRAIPVKRRRYGLRRHFALEPWTDVVEVHFGARTEAYITPVGDDTVGVALLGPQGFDFDEELASFPRITRALGDAAPASTLRGAGPLRQLSTRRVAGRAALVGDASGYTDAITGEGLRVGMAQARSAIAAIVAGDLGTYERQWRCDTREFRLLTNQLVVLATSPLRPLLVPTMLAVPGVFGRIVDRIAR
jgi:flavin-dependent dehydrogenase